MNRDWQNQARRDGYADGRAGKPGAQSNEHYQRGWREGNRRRTAKEGHESHERFSRPDGRAAYRDEITMPGHLTLDELERVLDKIREYGSVDPLPRPTLKRVSVSFVADDDWDLREVLGDVEQELNSYGVEWTVDKSKLINAPKEMECGS